jgi:hypothetical protein
MSVIFDNKVVVPTSYIIAKVWKKSKITKIYRIFEGVSLGDVTMLISRCRFIMENSCAKAKIWAKK